MSVLSTDLQTPTTSPAGNGYQVTVPAPRPEWTKAFLADPHAQAFHAPEWIDGVCAAGGYTDATRLYQAPDGRQLVMPMVRRSYLGGVLSQQASLPPIYGVGGVIGTDEVRPEDLTVICADIARQRGVLRTFIRPAARTADVWAAADLPGVKSQPGLGHVLDLEGGFETVWTKRFTKTARTAVRKAEKCGVTVEHDTTGALLPAYFRLMESSIERWATQQNEPLLLSRLRARQRHTLEKMQTLAAAVPGRFHLYLAMWEGQPVAGNVVYQAADTRATSSAMIKELAGPVRANQLLDRHAIEDACAAGSAHYDLGESGNSSGLAMYKTRFGAQPVAYRKFVIERLPLTEVDRAVRSAAKKAIRFQEPPPLASEPA